MALPDFTMRQLLEAGVHFGHQTHRWNPKMAPYIYGDRNNIHIIDLAQTVPLLHQALKLVSDTVARGGRVLFVGTKRQASEIIADAAERSAQYYVNSRWLGGMLTNWKTISNSIQRLRNLDKLLEGEAQGFTKKERLQLERQREKLNRALGGIKDMGSTPDLIFVIDTNKELIAIQEAKKLGIPEPELDPAVLAGGVTGIGGTLANKGVGTGTEPEDAATDSVVSFVVVSRGAGLEGLLVSNGVGAVLEDLLSENGRAAMGGSFALEASCLIGET